MLACHATSGFCTVRLHLMQPSVYETTEKGMSCKSVCSNLWKLCLNLMPLLYAAELMQQHATSQAV